MSEETGSNQDEKRKAQIEQLRELIAYHNQLYYAESRSEISDQEYDRIKSDYEQLLELSGESGSSDALLQAVGDDRASGFKTYVHREPMGSLENTYSQQEVGKFFERVYKLLGIKNAPVIVQPKIDGLAISLTYENGILTRAVTRGNGIEGDDVTRNLSAIEGIVPMLSGGDIPRWMEIRGEVFISKEEFRRINAERSSRGESLYANPRNLASGTIKLLDESVLSTRKLNIRLYGLGACEPKPWDALSQFNDQLKSWGLPVVENTTLAANPEQAWLAIEQLGLDKHSFKYETDGAVAKIDSFELQERSGSTAKAPRWAIAFKFESEKATTILNNIQLQVGRTGAITPVANLEPVELCGTTVARATLHNFDEIARKDIREGDTVEIEKAGEIIPQVVRVVLDERKADSKAFVFEQVCPACGTELFRPEKEVVYRCPNLRCPPQVGGRIEHFVSKACMDIDSFGSAVVTQLLDAKLIERISDIYRLEKASLLTLDRFAEKSAENLISAIHSSKQQPLWRLIHGLGIFHVGASAAKLLAEHFRSLEALANASVDAIVDIKGLGETIAQSVVSFFNDESNQALVKALENAGLNVSESALETPDKEDLKLAGKTFVMTGTLPDYGRAEFEALIEKHGGKASKSISKNTDFLVAGEGGGSKLQKAQSLGVAVISQAQLLEML